ncbi:recombinase family protein [Nocardia terpenica]|uniref:Recombinase domain-containing protein n=1 Tax=Nocardia terpenica TaxID=455432 RepID=A0A6G9YZZ5_9NOCA|nr:recombinase family protein [Nocardia terpenica]QIS18919.1 hypothetical protein F6W96_12050 [Nocardia terpenica]
MPVEPSADFEAGHRERVVNGADQIAMQVLTLLEQRAPLVRRAWELYATGDYTIDDLETAMADLGLTCSPTPRWPGGRSVSATTLHRMLSDPYYTGYVTWKGQLYPGRHEPLITQELYDRVQDVLRQRSANGNRDRVHNHYLEGFLFCPHCRDNAETSRLVFNQTTNRHGTRYEYFVCRRAKEGLCDLPPLPVQLVEEAIVDHYRTLQLPADFAAETRTLLGEVVADEQTTVRELHATLTHQLKELDVKESRLIDLLTDSSMPPGQGPYEAGGTRDSAQADRGRTGQHLRTTRHRRQRAQPGNRTSHRPACLYRDGGPPQRDILPTLLHQRSRRHHHTARGR